MPLLTCEFDDGDVREWHTTGDGVESRWNRDYEPALFVDGPRDALDTLQQALRPDLKITSTHYEKGDTSLDAYERSAALRVGMEILRLMQRSI